MFQDDVRRIYDFIQLHDHCVLATTDYKGSPEAAIVEFVLGDNGQIIFDTSKAYRKYTNLIHNPNVAITIGNGEENKGVQYEGTATQLTGDDLKAAKEIYFARRPDARKWENDPATVYFKVAPRWLRMRDYTINPMSEIECDLGTT
ncbi:MAG: hypothetical protein A2855_00840 [Candidatus Liptonbacteria bacterium RIFCSPHIGHO2_01_FULL_57_28]|uniref:Pyridoxamine 5'-phosphate oxidase N-terminal domain-containing protein n=1 Tax=Candidatus Liptonbacteria bacterium RIFCSPHIGHO2_01_FULL_57_28 TaxID=1798647 RepID=A0A1G2CDL9_9BACT|nr:MAG: hypothetical protein A2855_00840 [Candidatus Liptonbacteria bacterium RIFCSPHIGHO2_01_FULL_57_28]